MSESHTTHGKETRGNLYASTSIPDDYQYDLEKTSQCVIASPRLEVLHFGYAHCQPPLQGLDRLAFS